MIKLFKIFSDNLFIINKLLILCITYILLYQVSILRSFCYHVLIFLSTFIENIQFDEIKSLYFILQNFVVFIIFIITIINIVCFKYRKSIDNKLNYVKPESRLETSLFRYLNNHNENKAFLVSGNWGTGKTFEINNFFEKYYKYSSYNIIKVSCFGLSTRADLVNSINKTIELNDKSIYSMIIKGLQLLPIIGEGLNKILSKNYDYSSLKGNNIYVFDDLERIAYTKKIDPYKKNIFYNVDPFAFRHGNFREDPLKEVRKELEKVTKGFQILEDNINIYSTNKTYDKFVAVIGLINDIVEKNNRVILICNTDIIGEHIVDDIFRSKLNVIEFRKFLTDESKYEIIDNIINNIDFDKADEFQIIKEFINDNKIDLICLFDNKVFENARIFQTLIQGFIYTAIRFEKEYLNNDFLYSLLFSMIILFNYNYNKDIKYYNKKDINKFINGSSIVFMDKIFNTNLIPIKLLEKISDTRNIRWIDASVSGYYLYNLTNPDSRIIDEWKNYKYYILEEKLLSDIMQLEKEEEFEIVHILYFYKNSNSLENNNAILRKILKNYIGKFNISDINSVNNILYNFSKYNSKFDNNVKQIVFEYLSQGKAKGEILQDNEYGIDYYHYYKNLINDEQSI